MNQNFKKISAITLAVLLGLTATPVSASSQSFTEIEKATLAETFANFSAQYAQKLQMYDTLQSGIHEDMTLTLDDAGRSLLGFVSPVDLSWFDNIRLSSDITTEENSQFLTAGLYLNDSKICTLEYFFDTDNLEIYMRIPELHSGYICVDYEKVLEMQKEALEEQREALEESDDTLAEATEETLEAMEYSFFSDPAFLKNYMSVMTNLPEYLPEPVVIETLLNKYCDILFADIQNEEAIDSSYNFNGSDHACVVYEGTLSQKDAQKTLQNLIDAASNDKQLKDILTRLDDGLKGEESIYETFIDALEDAAEDLDEDLAGEDSQIVASVSLDQNGNAVQRSLQIQNEEEITPLYKWEKNIDEDLVFSSLTIGDYEDGFTLYGNGIMKGDLLSGDYILKVSGEDVLNIKITDYDSSSIKNGEWYGSYEFSIPEVADMEEINPLQNFSLLMDVASEHDNGKINLSLVGSGSSLASLSIEAYLGATVEKPNSKDLIDVYDSLDEEAMNEYIESLSYETIFDNLSAAGMPDEIVSQLFASISPENVISDADFYEEEDLSEEEDFFDEDSSKEL